MWPGVLSRTHPTTEDTEDRRKNPVPAGVNLRVPAPSLKPRRGTVALSAFARGAPARPRRPPALADRMQGELRRDRAGASAEAGSSKSGVGREGGRVLWGSFSESSQRLHELSALRFLCVDYTHG